MSARSLVGLKRTTRCVWIPAHVSLELIGFNPKKCLRQDILI